MSAAEKKAGAEKITRHRITIDVESSGRLASYDTRNLADFAADIFREADGFKVLAFGAERMKKEVA